MTTWVDALVPGAPDLVAAWRGIETGQVSEVRREVRRLAGEGSAERIVPQLASLADALAASSNACRTRTCGATAARRTGTSPRRSGTTAMRVPAWRSPPPRPRRVSGRPDAPRVVLGVPGPADADRATLLRKIAQSQRIVERSARTVAGHETEPCPLDHPLVGRLRCGEWLVFAGVHDLMHLDQLHAIMAA